MDVTSVKVRFLVVRPWTETLAPIRKALRDAGFSARITRVDIEPALNAALSRSHYDVILFDPSTREITREIIEARLRDHRRIIPIVSLTSLDALVPAVRAALQALMN